MNHRTKIIITFFLNTALFVVAAALLPVLFEDNDDATMAWIASGIYSGTPDCHLVFINAIWGAFLAWLYTLIPTLEWYSIWFAILQIISMTIIVNYWMDILKNRQYLICSLVVFYLFWLLIIIRFQFTTTAAISAFAATLLLIRRRFISGGSLLLIASMVRFSAAGLVGLIMAPAFITSYKFDVKRSYLPMIIVLCIVVFAYKADSLFYSSPEWKYYSEFNVVRGKINDNPNLWRVVGNLPDNISEVEFNSIAGFAIDPNITERQDLVDILQIINNTPLYKKAKNIYPSLIKKNWCLVVLIALLFSSSAYILSDKKVVSKLFFVFIFWLCVLWYISLNGALKPRVLFSSLYPILFYGFYVLSKAGSNSHKHLLLYISSFCICLYFGYNIYQQKMKICKKYELFADQTSLINDFETKTIIPGGSDFMVEMFPPFHLSSSIRPRQFINPYCMMDSPLNNRYDSFDDLLRPDLCILAKEGRDFSNYITILSDYYGINADTVIISNKGQYILVQFQETAQD